MATYPPLDPATEAWMITQGMTNQQKQEFRRQMHMQADPNVEGSRAWHEAQVAADPYTHSSQRMEPEVLRIRPKESATDYSRRRADMGGQTPGFSPAPITDVIPESTFDVTPPLEEVLASPSAGTPETPPTPPAVEPTPEPRAPMTSWVETDPKTGKQRRVFGNVPPSQMSDEMAAQAYEQGVNEWKQNAMQEEAARAEGRRLRTLGGDIELPGETITVVPPDITQGITRPAPTAGRPQRDFRVQEGRGGYSPSAPVPTAGTITQEEYQALTPGQKRAYDEEYAGWAQREAVQRELDPLRVYNQAAEQIMRDFPEIQTRLDAYTAELQKYLDDKQITPEMFRTAIEGKKRELINEAMMQAGASAASLDPRTHQRTGVMGGLI